MNVGDRVRVSLKAFSNKVRELYKANNIKYLNVLYTPDVFTIHKVIQKRTSTKRGKYSLKNSDDTLFDGYGDTVNRRKTFYKNELLKIDNESKAPTKIKSMEDANTINLVSSSSQGRKRRNTTVTEVPEAPEPVIEQVEEPPIRKKKPKQTRKQTSTPEPPKITITRSGRQAKPKKMFGEALPVGELKQFLNQSYQPTLKNLGNYNVDRTLSGQRVQVYHNPDTNKAVVVHRGSYSIQDWRTNVLALFGYKGKRYNHSKTIQDKAEAKYGKENITTLGHSLGARLAEQLGRDTSEVITLNKPTYPNDILKSDKVPDNQTDVKSSSDPVSILRGKQKGNNPIVIPSKIIANPVTEHSVNVLERLPDELMVGSSINLSSNLHSTLVNILRKQMMLSHQIKMML